MEVHYTLRQLQYFVAVSQVGTLNEAASRCHVSPPALSLAISELERSLGVKLLVRHRSKGTHLTPGGSRVLKLAESLLAQARDLQESADAESGGYRGRQPSGQLPHHAGSPVRPDPSHRPQGRVQGLIECRRLGHQYHLPELPVDSREAPALTLTRTSTSCGIRAFWISEADAPGASAPSVTA